MVEGMWVMVGRVVLPVLFVIYVNLSSPYLNCEDIMQRSVVEVRPDWDQIGLLIVALVLMAALIYAGWATGRNGCVRKKYIDPATRELVVVCVLEEMK